MADIFLSYANEDRETARAVAGLLESAGCTVWWDRRIPAGRTWRSMIEEALHDMRCMVVLWSSHSVESDWVKEEAEEARALGKLIPVMIEPVKPPVGFRSIQAADLTQWDGSRDYLGARQLITDLESLLGKSAPTKRPDSEAAPQITQPIPESAAAEASVVGASGASHEDSRPAESRPVSQFGTVPLGSSRKPAVGWKTVAVGVFIIVAALGSFFWLAKKDRQTPTPETEALKPPSLASQTEAPETEPPKPPPVSAPSVVALGLSAERQEIKANETLNVTLKGQFSDGSQKRIQEGVEWLSSEPSVATIDDQGRVEARQAGETKITARYGDLVSSAWTLAVRAEKPVVTAPAPSEKPVTKTPPPTKLVALTVSAPRREVKTQERLPLRAKARYSDGNEKGISKGVEWRTSDASIASVDSRGELVALRPGKIAVVARWGGIESVGLDIVVRESPTKVVRESPPKPSSEPPTYKPVVEPPSAPVKPVVELPPAPPAKPRAETINLGAYINRAKAYRVQGNYAAALTELEKGRALNPSSQEVIDEIEATRRACNAEKRLGREDLNC